MPKIELQTTETKGFFETRTYKATENDGSNPTTVTVTRTTQRWAEIDAKELDPLFPNGIRDDVAKQVEAKSKHALKHFTDVVVQRLSGSHNASDTEEHLNAVVAYSAEQQLQIDRLEKRLSAFEKSVGKK